MTLFQVFHQSPLSWTIFAILLGLIVGSFLNVLVYRLPIMMHNAWQDQADATLGHLPRQRDRFDLVHPPSHCRHCGHRIRYWENVPLFSYLFLQGHCASCGQPIGIRYPLVELGCGLLSGYVAWHFGFGWQAAVFLLLAWGLLSVSLIDLDHQLLPDVLVLPLLWLGLIINSFEGFTTLHDALWGAVAGYLVLWSVYWVFKLITGKEGMGHGDFKLLALLGAWGGWQILPLVILLSSILGTIYGVASMHRRNASGVTTLPFGPFLAAAGLIGLLWGGSLNELYLRWAGFIG